MTFYIYENKSGEIIAALCSTAIDKISSGALSKKDIIRPIEKISVKNAKNKKSKSFSEIQKMAVEAYKNGKKQIVARLDGNCFLGD